MIDNIGLTACIFDALPNLQLSSDSQGSVLALERAESLLVSAQDTELPVLVRFLLESSTSITQAHHHWNVVREKLHDFFQATTLSTSHSNLWQSQPFVTAPPTAKMLNTLSCINLILTMLPPTFLSKSFLFPAYFLSLEGKEDESFATFHEVDFWICVALYALPKYR